MKPLPDATRSSACGYSFEAGHAQAFDRPEQSIDSARWNRLHAILEKVFSEKRRGGRALVFQH
jgi:hypothetical protein